MRSPALALLTLIGLVGCRSYPLESHLKNQAGLLPADQFAAYGREQAIVVAIGREFGRPYNSGLGAPAQVAMAYAQQFPDIVEIKPDTLGHRLTVQFASGWRAAVVPIDDGKRGTDTRIPN